MKQSFANQPIRSSEISSSRIKISRALVGPPSVLVMLCKRGSSLGFVLELLVTCARSEQDAPQNSPEPTVSGAFLARLCRES